MKTLITICARSGSQGVPNKNIKEINRIPLIAYSVLFATELKKRINADIALSTDSKEYIDIVSEFGLKSNYIRPEKLATNSVGKIDVFKDVLDFYEKENNVRYDYLLDLEVTSPLRTIDDIMGGYNLMKENPSCLVVYGATLSVKNPYYNLVEQKENGFYKLCIEAGENILTRQSAPKVYESNGMFYLFNRDYFDGNYNTIFTDKTLIFPSNHISIDVDNPIDFDFLEYLIKFNKLDFEFDFDTITNN